MGSVIMLAVGAIIPSGSNSACLRTKQPATRLPSCPALRCFCTRTQRWTVARMRVITQYSAVTSPARITPRTATESVQWPCRCPAAASVPGPWRSPRTRRPPAAVATTDGRGCARCDSAKRSTASQQPRPSRVSRTRAPKRACRARSGFYEPSRTPPPPRSTRGTPGSRERPRTKHVARATALVASRQPCAASLSAVHRCRRRRHRRRGCRLHP
mmetsp:Transcript_52906/g.146207  ORF Transcript_52906/g.146207 Transcript_52906/m.146207 type:complete len:214 (+) Transcript_52906:326-967(+)